MAFDATVVVAHAAAIEHAHWFARAGLPFTVAERNAFAAMARRAVRVRTWEEARRIVDDVRAAPGHDVDAGEVVELKSRALLTVSPDTLLEVMSHVVDCGHDVFLRAATRAARRAPTVVDEATVRLAAGAASEAVYRGALAAAVDGTGHRFVETEALFAAGRWPLARINDELFVF